MMLEARCMHQNLGGKSRVYFTNAPASFVRQQLDYGAPREVAFHLGVKRCNATTLKC
jgi:hypothetical protein